jgi:predicted RNase H-like nuclease
LYKKRPPKIRIKKRAEQKKPKKKAKRRKRMKKSKLMKMLENMDEIEESKLEGLRWSDRLMVEVYKEIDGMEPVKKDELKIIRKV